MEDGENMKKKYDIVALGELLIDFTEAGTSKNGMKLFEQNPGGAPANLLTAASHMGCQTAIIGKVGADMHGDFLLHTLQKEGIDTTYLVQDEKVYTTLAFVAINDSGERQFSFARKPGADTCLSVQNMNNDILTDCKIFHVGSLSLTDEPSKTATYWGVKIAKEAGALISYDPNYRSSLWKDERTAIATMSDMIPLADLMKVSDEECQLLTGEEEYLKAAKKLLDMGPKIVAVTLGSHGVLLVQKDRHEIVPGFKVNAVDTTGAGDSFWGGFLSSFLEYEKHTECMQWQEWKNCSVRANAIAALCVQERGGIPAIPEKKRVLEMISDYKHK